MGQFTLYTSRWCAGEPFDNKVFKILCLTFGTAFLGAYIVVCGQVLMATCIHARVNALCVTRIGKSCLNLQNVKIVRKCIC
jgi:hypothetical protein